MTKVISALPVNHRVGLSLKNLILKIRSHVNDRRSLWGKLLSSMIWLRLNVTITCALFRLYRSECDVPASPHRRSLPKLRRREAGPQMALP